MNKLGNGLSAELDGTNVTLYKNGSLLKLIDIGKAINRRLLTVELINDLGARPSHVSQALRISRQTIYNTLDTYKRFGVDGLLHSEKRGVGNKARLHKQHRKLASETAIDNQIVLQLTEEAPENFEQTHEWQKSRYAGGLIFSAILQKDWQFMILLIKSHETSRRFRNLLNGCPKTHFVIPARC